jgi:hypothetical protein
MFRLTGDDWLLILLDGCNAKQRARVLLLLWRAWHLRCDVIHKQGKETISNSVSFLLNYDNMLSGNSAEVTSKGKSATDSTLQTNIPCYCLSPHSRGEAPQPPCWTAPPEGVLLINVDAAHKP